MTPTARAYTRMHRRADLFAMRRAARQLLATILIAAVILSVTLPVVWDAPARIAADQIAAQMEGGW